MPGKLISKLSGEDAYDFRENVRAAGGSKEYFEKVKNNMTEIKLLDYTYANLDSVHLGVDRTYQFQFENPALATVNNDNNNNFCVVDDSGQRIVILN